MPDHDEDHYRLRIARPEVVALTTTLPEKVAHAAYAFITGALSLSPHRVGKPLNPPLAPAFSARRGDYRILYLIDDDAKTVSVTAIAHRGNIYQTP
jgi:mRNA interferase RelE/StbE